MTSDDSRTARPHLRRVVLPGSGPACRPTGRTAPPGTGVLTAMLPPPPWAANSVVEDGGVTHEVVSAVHPLLVADRTDPDADLTYPSDLSLSVFDAPGGVHWVRGAPTVQVEGGSYSLPEARRLMGAIDALLALARADAAGADGEPADADRDPDDGGGPDRVT
jgi:hypothetical protein